MKKKSSLLIKSYTSLSNTDYKWILLFISFFIFFNCYNYLG